MSIFKQVLRQLKTPNNVMTNLLAIIMCFSSSFVLRYTKIHLIVVITVFTCMHVSYCSFKLLISGSWGVNGHTT